jgi:hypothetical protein
MVDMMTAQKKATATRDRSKAVRIGLVDCI